MEHIYNNDFSKQQIQLTKKELHNKIHWLLIYKEENYPKLDEYFESLLTRIGGLNSLLLEQKEIVTLMSLLQGAREELNSKDFDFHKYRKIILDSHSILDKVKEE